jgi:TRAP-type C4-dicarboxylate transport system permease small subunit
MNAQPGDRATGPESVLAKPDRWLGRVEDMFDLAAAGFIMFLMFFGVAQVIARKIFNYPLWGYTDIVQIVMVTFAFLGVAYCQRLGGHVRMELVIRQLRGRALWIVEAIGVLVGVGIVAALLWYGYTFFLRAYLLGDSTIDREIIIWPSKLVVPIALLALLLRLLLQFFGYVRLAAYPGARPVAVPLIEDIAKTARREIEEALGDDAADEPAGKGAG